MDAKNYKFEPVLDDEVWEALEMLLENQRDGKKVLFAINRVDENSGDLLSSTLAFQGKRYRSSKNFCRYYDFLALQPAKNCAQGQCNTAGNNTYQFRVDGYILRISGVDCQAPDLAGSYSMLTDDITDNLLGRLYSFFGQVADDINKPLQQRATQPFDRLHEENERALQILKKCRFELPTVNNLQPSLISAPVYLGNERWVSGFVYNYMCGDSVAQKFVVRILFGNDSEPIAYHLLSLEKGADIPSSPWEME